MRFVVEVDHVPSSDPALVKRVLEDLLERATQHPLAFTGGIRGARIIVSYAPVEHPGVTHAE